MEHRRSAPQCEPRLPAAHGGHGEPGLRFEKEGGQGGPLIGELGPRGIDGGGPGELHLSQFLVGGEHPDLALGPLGAGALRRGGRRSLQRLGTTLDPGEDPDGVAAPADLDTERPVLDPGGEVPAHRDRGGVGQEGGRERHLAGASGHLELEPGLHEQGNPVGDVAEDLEADVLAFAQALVGPRPEPQQPPLLPPGAGHRAPVQDQLHEADRAGEGQGLGQTGPGEAAAHLVTPGGEAHPGRTVLSEHRHRPPVDPHVLGPDLGRPREAQARLAVGVHGQGEASPGPVEVEAEASRPDADRPPLHPGATQPRHGIEDPRHPGAELRGQALSRDRLRPGGAG